MVMAARSRSRDREREGEREIGGARFAPLTLREAMMTVALATAAERGKHDDDDGGGGAKASQAVMVRARRRSWRKWLSVLWGSRCSGYL